MEKQRGIMTSRSAIDDDVFSFYFNSKKHKEFNAEAHKRFSFLIKWMVGEF